MLPVQTFCNNLIRPETTIITEPLGFSLLLGLPRWELKMHPLFEQASEITHDIIGAALDVHKEKGPGLLETIYEWCLTKELQLRGYQVKNQELVEVQWKQFRKEYPLKFDLLINSCLLIEVKATESFHPIHKAQLLSYMKLLDIPLGLIINFHELKLVDRVSRLILPGANAE